MKKLIIASLLLIGTLDANAMTYCSSGWQKYISVDDYMGVYFMAQCGNSTPINVSAWMWFNI